MTEDNKTQETDTIEVCCYCGEERTTFVCCGEVHFVQMIREAWENGEEV